MKTYNEMAKNALERINEHNNKIMKRNKLIKKTLIPAFSICLVTLIGITLYPQLEIEVSPNTNYPTEQPSDDIYENRRLAININEINSKIPASKLNYDSDFYSTESFTVDEMVKYLGIDLRNLSFLKQEDDWKYQVIDKYTVIYEKKSGNLVFDWSFFNYVRDDNKKLVISAGKVMVPYDCEYMYDSEPKGTTFKTAAGGMSIIIGGTKAEDTLNNVQVDDSEVYKLLVADFEYNGINYRVEAENIKAQEFHGIIETILSTK